jgi:glutamyl-tRNA synthetase
MPIKVDPVRLESAKGKRDVDARAGRAARPGAAQQLVKVKGELGYGRNGRSGFEPAPKQLSLDEIRKLGGLEVAPEKRAVKLRFAPSPTGQLHIGGARTALMNYLAAKKLGGEFVLRIEDTDLLRSKPEYTQAIKDSLTWLGIHWDGDILYQSQRGALYKAKVDQLLEADRAYKDASGAVFFKMPEEGSLMINDRVKGTVIMAASKEGGNKDYVIQRADTNPTFLMANVVDDGEEGITHVIRGDDHLSNAIRQIPLYRALGYQVPEFFHVPLIHGDDGAKLSKRHGAQSVMDFKEAGYDPLVLVNHLARLGMSVGEDDTASMEDLVRRTTLQFSSAPAKIGFKRLGRRSLQQVAGADAGLLQEEVRQRDPQLAERLGASGLAALVEASRGRVETYSDIVKLGRLLVDDPIYKEAESHTLASAAMRRLLGRMRAELQALPAREWTSPKLNDLLEAFNKRAGVTFTSYTQSLRWSLTGLPDGVPLNDTLAILGRAEALRRLGQWSTP